LDRALQLTARERLGDDLLKRIAQRAVLRLLWMAQIHREA
jgi:hypothetical protein